LVFSQFRFDIGQIHLGVHLVFVPPGYAPLTAKHPIFIDFEMSGLSELAHRDIVCLGIGKIVQRCPIVDLRHHTQIHLQARAQYHGGTGLAVRHDTLDILIVDKALHHWRTFLAGHQNVQISDGFEAAPLAPGHDQILDAVDLLQDRPAD
jgi:hypothetical protein